MGRMLDEAELVGRRVSNDMAQRAVLFRAAMSAIPNMATKKGSSEKASKVFEDIVARMMGD